MQLRCYLKTQISGLFPEGIQFVITELRIMLLFLLSLGSCENKSTVDRNALRYYEDGYCGKN